MYITYITRISPSEENSWYISSSGILFFTFGVEAIYRISTRAKCLLALFLNLHYVKLIVY